jgi:hypothetical protein
MAVLVLGAAFTAAQGKPRLEGIPRLSHVFIIVLENEAESVTWGPASPAKYLLSLRKQGELLTNYYGVGHESNDNYISLTSGEPPLPDTMADCPNYQACVTAVSSTAFGRGTSIADQLETRGLSWKGYFEDMPGSCVHATGPVDSYQGDSTKPPAYNYADRHNPFVYYRPIAGSTARCRKHVVPYAQLARDFKDKSVPNYAFIVPNTCDDGHDSPCANGKTGGLLRANAWLAGNAPRLVTYVRKHNGLLAITTDESSNSDTGGCCGGGIDGTRGFGGDVGLLAISPWIPKGVTNRTAYDHASLLRTVEDGFGIKQHLNDAGSANEHAMTDVFRVR